MSTVILSDAVNTIDLLQSIYFDNEFTFQHSEDESFYSVLKTCHDSDDWSTLPKTYPQQLEFIVKAPIDLPELEENPLHLTFNGRISLVSMTEYQLHLPSAANLWLSRDDHQLLVNTFNEIHVDESEDRSTHIIEKIQQMQVVAESYAIQYLEKSKLEAQKELEAREGGPVRFLRDWIWFPMIYTREKRGDIIDWAPKYGITGFLCPGKPGCMCLEGSEKKVVQFVNDIKTISWASIPAGHRKMTSRWKQLVDCQNEKELNDQRIFKDMTEVKFDIHGHFANHNDLSMLQSWMQERGCGEAFEHLFDYDS